MAFFEALYFLAFVLSPIMGSNCPSIDDLPVTYGDVFACAQYWKEYGSQYSVDSCNGHTAYMTDGQDWSAAEGYMYEMGSFAVMPGCTMYQYMGSSYTGERRAINGPHFTYNNVWGNTPAKPYRGKGPSSIKCRCVQTLPNCEPEDGYDVVLVCDNTGGLVDTYCSYSHTVGTSYSSSMTEEMSISVGVSETMSASYFGLFTASLEISVNTGYDWSETTETTMNEQTTIELQATAPAGMTLMVEQAVGHCGGSESRTEMFRTSHYSATGHLVFRELGELRDGVMTPYKS